MRDTTAQRVNTMIPIGALQQAPEPHVSHAETGAFIKAANCEPRYAITMASAALC